MATWEADGVGDAPGVLTDGDTPRTIDDGNYGLDDHVGPADIDGFWERHKDYKL